ncbi:uncharacterized protein RHOBADRAFT_56484 [Rhodotorula graminis WP1]|uniref:Uncharacterized protein n=1 Tax=Rhodotorula graminis (strain WP1) TaxID=578459 RepID=A0A0P9GFS0_RHOGW|nr:uncharacterized protein RHOBADRAFT_56484 [Rhodotorula graminis WP1]KPV71648.1 hypothetical protein RHOBADRAFT_56484 [Rhodotorula graminis WP1]
MASTAPAPESLLAVAHSLRSTLSTLVSPDGSHHHSHALSQVPPAAIPYLKQRTRDSITHLRAGLTALSHLALDGAPAAPPRAPTTQPDPRDRDKLLTLLRDAALAEQPLLDARTASLSASSSSSSRALFPARTPAPGSGARGILDTLERVAADLGLVHLRDDPALDGRDEGPVVLSLGGKLMAVDVELSSTSTSDAPQQQQQQRVERTKVAYVVAGHDAQCPAASDKLHALLAAPPSATTESSSSSAQVRWRGVRTLLEELHELDDATERTGDDCFARLTRDLPVELAQAISSSPTSLRLLPSPSSLLPRLVYHSPPIPLSSSTTSDDDDGTHTATISLTAIVNAPLASGGSDLARPYVARLSPAVPLSRRTARKVCEALGLEIGHEGAARMDEEGQGELDRDEQEDAEGWVGALLGAQDGLERAQKEGATTTHPDCPPLSFTLTPAPPSLPPTPSTASSAPSPSPRPAPRLVATHLRFAHAPQLVAALGVLDAQVRAGALVRSAVVVPRGSSPAGRMRAGAEGAARPAKRARAREGGGLGGMTLEDLFAPPSPGAPPPPVPISVHPTSSPRGPGVTFTFPLLLTTSTSTSSCDPGLAGAPVALELVCPYAHSHSEGGAFTARLHLPRALKLASPPSSSSPGGAQAGEGSDEEQQQREEAARARLERRLERVARVSGGDAGLVVREVLRRVGAAMAPTGEEGEKGGS